ncbi:MAG TPA: segregation/condensation protein A [Gammaproteobacteria bacterium]|nr:segregation/condensation protein A [Gammaproteobacteria bacterium]
MTDTYEQQPPSRDQPGQQAAQAEMPFAVVQGEAMTVLPKDLYIPPEALEVILEAFEGPLDLLLYLIRRQNLDVLNIPIAEITRQYMEYVEMMKSLNLELAADYLVMAAMLAEIKSRMLLPRPVEEDNEEDPRAELVRRLQEYERFKQAAEDIDSLPRMNREVFQASAKTPDLKLIKPEPEVDMRELLSAFKDVLVRVELNTHHQVSMEPLSVRERMSDVLSRLDSEKFTEFSTLFSAQEGRLGVVVTFLAILELIKESLIELIQTEPYEPIHIKPRASS